MSTLPKFASLPMYDFPTVMDATDQLWSQIHRSAKAKVTGAPEKLSRDVGLWEAWQSENLFMAQTCGFPYVHKLRGQVGLVGTPDYGVVAGKPGWYYSVILCRREDPRQSLADFSGATFALNETGSQSGCQALMHTLKSEVSDEKLLGDNLITGAHALSAKAVLAGKADIASVDIVTWLHLQRDHPELSGLRVLMETDPTPGLPYITALGEATQTLGDCVAEAIGNLPRQAADKLFLKGLWRSTEADYDLIQNRAKAADSVFNSYFPDGQA